MDIFSLIPALTPPKGVKSNFENPARDNGAAYAVLIIGLVLSTVSMIIRAASRAFVVRQIFLSDVILFISYGLYITLIGLCFKLAHHPGFFVHQWDVNVPQIIPYLHTTFVGVVIFCVFMGLVKTAILVEWLRVFIPCGTRNTLYYVLQTVLWGNLIFYITMVILQNIACTPYEYTWNRTLLGGNCSRVNTNATDLATAITNLIVDVFILVIPQHVIWKLKMSDGKKFGLAGIFLVGLLGVIAAACRVVATVRALHDPDFVYNFGPVVICSVAEGACAILVVCGPTIPKVLEQLHIPFLSKISATVRSWLGSSSHFPWSKQSSNEQKSTGSGSDSSGKNTMNTWPRGSFATVMKGKEYDNITQGHSLESLERGPVPPIPARFELSAHAEEGQIIRTREVIVTSNLFFER